jgi:hypothetical protein
VRGLDPRIHLKGLLRRGWIAGSRLRQGYAGPRVHSAAEALAKAASPAMTRSVRRMRFLTPAGYSIRVDGGRAYFSGAQVPHFSTAVCRQSCPRATHLCWHPSLSPITNLLQLAMHSLRSCEQIYWRNNLHLTHSSSASAKPTAFMKHTVANAAAEIHFMHYAKPSQVSTKTKRAPKTSATHVLSARSFENRFS